MIVGAIGFNQGLGPQGGHSSSTVGHLSSISLHPNSIGLHHCSKVRPGIGKLISFLCFGFWVKHNEQGWVSLREWGHMGAKAAAKLSI